jgi:hypothetical protein
VVVAYSACKTQPGGRFINVSRLQLHWVLDVVFREDARRVYDRTTAENVAFLNRLAVSLLRGDPGKGSLKVKRKRAGWHLSYLAQLLGFSST